MVEGRKILTPYLLVEEIKPPLQDIEMELCERLDIKILEGAMSSHVTRVKNLNTKGGKNYV